MIQLEKDLYQLIEDYLILKKSCFKEYVGNELFMGSDRQMRANVFGISKDDSEKIIYLLEGKLRLKGRGNFSKVLCEAIPLLEFADFVYIFGISDEEDFKSVNKKYYEICKLLGIGILLFNENGDIIEILKPDKNVVGKSDKKEMIFRIFTKKIDKSPISMLIFQATYEYVKLNDLEGCAQFIEIYNSLFVKKDYKKILKETLSKDYSLNEISMRKTFQKDFGESDLVNIRRMNRAVDDYICITENGRKIVSEPILLD